MKKNQKKIMQVEKKQRQKRERQRYENELKWKGK